MNVLFLTHRVPYAPNRGDRVRAFHIARVLASSCDLSIVSLAHDAGEADEIHRLAPFARAVRAVRVPAWRNKLRGLAALAASATPLTHVLLDAPSWRRTLAEVTAAHRPDVVLAYCSGMARLALEPPLDRVPRVVDMVDVDSAKWAALSRRSRPPLAWVYGRESRVLAGFEASAAARSYATLVVNDRERQTMAGLAPAARIEVVENGVDASALAPPSARDSKPDVVFCGVFDYAPNVEAAVWLATRVWPLVRAARPDARLMLVGANPAPDVQRLARTPGVIVTGSVPDVRPFLWTASVAAAPLHVARGVQNKVLEAVAAGLPAVVTPAVMAGLPAEVAPACRAADTEEAFAEALLEMLGLSPQQRRDAAARADLCSLTWEKRLARLPGLLEAAAAG